MAETDISNYSQFDPQSIPGFTPTAPSSEAPSSPLTDSSIQQSELVAIALMMIAGIPILAPPEVNGNASSKADQVAALEFGVAQKTHDIISKMWDTYIENIRQVAERLKKEDIKKQTEDADKPGPMSSTQYFTYLMSLSSTKRADEVESNTLTLQFTNTFNQWMITPIPGGSDTATSSAGAYPSAAFAVGSVASNPDLIRLAIGADSALLGVYLSSSPVADAIHAVGPTTGLPVDSQAAAAMVAALLNGGALLRATAMTMVKGPDQPQYDLNFAMAYANNIKAIVTQNLGETDPNRMQQNNMIRLMLSAMALNMLYRAAYGGMAGLDMAALLNGSSTKDIPDPEVRKLVDQLVSMINAFMPKGKREEIIARLSEYVDSKESVDSMLETTGLFTASLDTKRLTENTA